MPLPPKKKASSGSIVSAPNRPPFSGGGKAGRYLTALEWSEHPLGPVDAWPVALRMAVRLTLGTSRPAWLGWGDDLYVFCNDAFLAAAGWAADPTLGRPAREVWAEGWSEIGPRLDALTTGSVDAAPTCLPWPAGARGASKTGPPIGGVSCRPLVDEASGEVGGVFGEAVEEGGAAESSGAGLAPAELLQQIPVALYTCDAEGYITTFNAAAVELWGGTPRPGEDRWCGSLRLYHPDGSPLPKEDCPMARALREGRVIRGVQAIVERPDGERRHVLPYVEPLRNSAGEITGAVNLVVDITEQLQTDLASERLAAIVESSEDAILTKTVDGVIQTWNGAAERLFGYTSDEIIGRSVLLLIPPDRHAEEHLILQRLRRGESMAHYETVRVCKDGTHRHVSLSVSPLKDAAGRIVSASIIARDITGRKRTEAELQRREQLYRAVGESLDYGIWICDADGRNVYASDSFLRLTGISQQDCSDHGWARLLHPDEAEATLAAWQETVRTGDGALWEREHRVLGVDGAWHPILARGVPVRDADGRITSWVGINLDISRLKENEEMLRRQSRRLEALNHLGRRLAVEHEIEPIVQAVTDAAREASGAALAGYFSHEEQESGDFYPLFALSGARREEFEDFGMPRSTPLFGPTFRGDGPVRIADVQQDARYGTMPPHRGVPRGHPSVRSYLAVPIVLRTGAVHGGLFLGHPEVGVFSPETEETVMAIAAQAAIAIDNANLYRDMERELREHEKTEQALRESEERFRTLADNIATLAWTADRLGWATWYNKRWYEYTGTTFAEMQGNGWSKVLHPDHLERVKVGLQRSVDAGAPWEDIFPLRGHDGQFRWFLSRAVPIHDAEGKVVRWFGSNTDITESKAAEAQLRQRSERMQLLSEILAGLITAHDADHLVRDLFPRVSAHLEADAYINCVIDESAGGLRLHSWAGIDDAAARAITGSPDAPAICGTVAEARTPVVFEDIQQTEDKQAKLMRGCGMRTYVSNPLMVGDRLLGTLAFASRSRARFDADELEFLRIVTQSAAVALDRLRVEQAVRDSEERFRNLADNIAQFAWTADPTGSIFWYNRRWFDYTGTTFEEMEGWGWQSVHHPDHVQRVVKKFAGQIAKGEVWEDTFPLRRHDGVYRWFLSRAVPIRGPEGYVVQWFGTNTDVTEQLEVEFALERARDEALAASRAKDDFLAALSHELRTPLNPVLLLASDAAENPALPQSVRADFETIRKHVSLEARLIDDLLDLTRIARGKLSLDLAEHDAHAILRDALETVQPEAEANGISLSLGLHASNAQVRGDAVRLQQVFWNVLKNAVKFTPRGGHVDVATRTDDEQGRMEIRITDTGIGLAPEEISRIFDAFSQGDHAGGSEPYRFGGLGLGLTISRMVITLHEGSIRATSEGPGKGSAFIIELPVMAETELTEESMAGLSTNTSDQREAHVGGRILLVEDHGPTRVALERLLIRRKFTVEAASSLVEARELMRSGQFDLLISDIGLPDGSGCDLMRECAADLGRPGIALTGYGMEQDIERSRAAGFAAHLTKPISVESLDRAIAEVWPAEKEAT